VPFRLTPQLAAALAPHNAAELLAAPLAMALAALSSPAAAQLLGAMLEVCRLTDTLPCVCRRTGVAVCSLEAHAKVRIGVCLCMCACACRQVFLHEPVAEWQAEAQTLQAEAGGGGGGGGGAPPRAARGSGDGSGSGAAALPDAPPMAEAGGSGEGGGPAEGQLAAELARGRVRRGRRRILRACRSKPRLANNQQHL
jgi:hypothetical protein